MPHVFHCLALTPISSTFSTLLQSIIDGYTTNLFCAKLLNVNKSIDGTHWHNSLLYIGEWLVIPHMDTLCEDLFHLTHNTLSLFGLKKLYAAISEHHGYRYTHRFCVGFVMGTGTRICTHTHTSTRGTYPSLFGQFLLLVSAASMCTNKTCTDNPPPASPQFPHQTPTNKPMLWWTCHTCCHPITLSFNHHHHHHHPHLWPQMTTGHLMALSRAQQREREGREEDGEKEEWRKRGGGRGRNEAQ